MINIKYFTPLSHGLISGSFFQKALIKITFFFGGGGVNPQVKGEDTICRNAKFKNVFYSEKCWPIQTLTSWLLC